MSKWREIYIFKQARAIKNKKHPKLFWVLGSISKVMSLIAQCGENSAACSNTTVKTKNSPSGINQAAKLLLTKGLLNLLEEVYQELPFFW
jgi:hypothetical protein